METLLLLRMNEKGEIKCFSGTHNSFKEAIQFTGNKTLSSFQNEGWKIAQLNWNDSKKALECNICQI